MANGSGAPDAVWFAVQSKSTWDSPNGSGDADNGLKDPMVATATHGESSGMKIYRVTGGSFSTTVPQASASVTLNNPMSGQTATAACSIFAFITDKNAVLARVDNPNDAKAMVLNGNTYTANTLLSWVDDGDGVPGPTYQRLQGTYGGTWNKLSDGSTDNVNVTWNGGTNADDTGYTPNPGEDHHTTFYPRMSDNVGGKMPMADLTSCGQKTQTWKYVVKDQKDQSEIELDCNWICHFAYEDFQQISADYNDFPDVADGMPDYSHVQDYTTTLSSTDQTGIVQVPGNAEHPLRLSTDFYARGTSQTIPGFVAKSKHVGIAAFQERVGRTTPYSWPPESVTVHWSEIWGDGEYGVRKSLQRKLHYGFTNAWNSKGEKAEDTILRYWLDNEGQVTDEPISPAPHVP